MIIVDDCSTDNTVSIAKEYEAKDSRIKMHINEENLGDYPNRNKAASYAKGKYLKYLDADDLIYYYGLEAMVKAMEQFPEAGFGLASKPDDQKPFPACILPKEIYVESFNGYGHFERAPGSSIIKSEAFRKVNGFSGARMIGDYEFWFKISRYYPMVKFPMNLYWNRLHEGQELQSVYAKENYPILRKAILEEALSHPDIPLNTEEIAHVKSILLKRNKKRKALEILRKVRRTFG